MTQNYNTRGRKDTIKEQDAFSKLEDSISISSLRDQTLILKDIVIKKLQEDNVRLNCKCSYLGNRVELLESKLNHLDHYGRRNNLVFPIQ